ncbi:MAG: hypothetical protein KGQ79_07240 [Proteobacteria bacterium]|nr:hypothetical protein [Pseudomonadota bacterium]MBU6426243.1 hypothetical protein [Rhodospirillales bacterium]
MKQTASDIMTTNLVLLHPAEFVAYLHHNAWVASELMVKSVVAVMLETQLEDIVDLLVQPGHLCPPRKAPAHAQ